MDSDFEEKLEWGRKLTIEADALFGKATEPESSYHSVIRALARRTHDTYRAVIELLPRDLVAPSLMLTRSILEVLVDMDYISQDPKKMTDLFLGYDFVERKRLLDGLKKFDAGSDRIKDLEKRWNTEFEPSYQKVKGNYRNEVSWSSKSLGKRAAEVSPELAKNVWTLNPYLSGYVHGGPLALADYALADDFNKLESDFGSSLVTAEEAMAMAFALYVLCLQTFASAWTLDTEDLHFVAEEGKKLFGWLG